MNKLNPPLKWAGGKRWLVPYLKSLWEKSQRKRLVEPLCGGLAVALGLMPKQALLNDINPHAINFFRWLKKGLVIERPMKNEIDFFYRCRNEFNALIQNGSIRSKKAAELFYYLNRTDYNGLCRFNNSGKFNVPFGKYKKINYVRDFTPYRELFTEWEFARGDFQKIAINSDDFIYADPPYDVEFTKYSKEDFKWEDQERLASWLSQHKGIVILSNQATSRIIALYKKLGFTLRFLRAPRMISCNGDRTPAKEVLAIRGL
jgi:DNA adenine methylase